MKTLLPKLLLLLALSNMCHPKMLREPPSATPSESRSPRNIIISLLVGTTFTDGYIDLSRKNESIYYTYWRSKSKNPNAPLIIANPGGPGVTVQDQIFVANGPLARLSSPFKKDWHSYLEFADVLLPSIPAGTGFSQTDDYTLTIPEMLSDCYEFFAKLSTQESSILNKEREIILYGTSYGVSILSSVGLNLIQNGFKIKGIYFDSPWVDPQSAVEKFPEIMKEYGVMSGSKLEYWTGEAQKCLDAIKGDPAKFTMADGKGCDQLYNGNRPYKNEFGLEDRNGYNLKAGNWLYGIFYPLELKLGDWFWHLGLLSWIFTGRKDAEDWNQQVYDNFQVLNYNYNGYKQDLFKLLDLGIKMSVTNGHFDGITNPMITRDWLMSYDKYFDGKWDSSEWIETKYGKKRVYKNFSYELVSDAGHFVGENNSYVTYEKIKELADAI
jgi:hypothetical protein